MPTPVPVPGLMWFSFAVNSSLPDSIEEIISDWVSEWVEETLEIWQWPSSLRDPW